MKEIVRIDQSDIIGKSTIGDLRYADDDIILLANIHNLTFNLSALRVDMLLIVICREGRIQVDINGTQHIGQKGNILVLNGLQILSDAMFTSDLTLDLVCISNARFDEIIHSDHKVMDTFLYINEHPVLNLLPDEFTLLSLYMSLVEQKLNMEPHDQLRHVINSILKAAIFDFIGITQRQRTKNISINSPTINLSRSNNEIVRKFLLMLVEDNAQHHTVQYFADKLCISPKYLSVVCRKHTGKKPSQWITEQQVEKIRTLLTTTNLSSKEIAARLNFSNTSFFGKFTRIHLGCSPMEYRKRNC